MIFSDYRVHDPCERLGLAEVGRGLLDSERRNGEAVAETRRTTIIARRKFELRASEVERGLRGVLPEPVREHYIVVNQRRYPPKQVLELVTGLDRAEFTTHHARRILTGLGFPAGRRRSTRERASFESPASTGRSSRSEVSVRPGVEVLEPFVEQWVATRGPEVLVAASDPKEVVGWLAENRQQADSMFRVPRDEFEASGVAPQ